MQIAYAPGSIVGQAVQGWADRIAVESGGELEINVFYSSSVVTATEVHDAVITGVLDMGLFLPVGTR